MTLLIEPKLPGHPIPRKRLVAEWEDMHHRNLMKGPVASFLFDGACLQEYWRIANRTRIARPWVPWPEYAL